MTRWTVLASVFTVGVLAVGGSLSPADAADVRIGVNIGPPPVFVAPPAPVFVAPPAPVVVAPGTPIYYYGSNYYTFYHGGWFLTPTYGSPWVYVPRAHVPHAIIGVPGAYYRIPPQRAARFAGPPQWHGQGRGHGHGHGHDKHRH